MTAFGIDFGTTNSVVAAFSTSGLEVLAVDEPPAAWAGRGLEGVLPSVVAFTDDGEPIFGWAAKRLPRSLRAAKRLLRDTDVMTDGESTFEVEEVATMLFKHLATASPGYSIDSAVVTVPANSPGVPRHRTKVCAGMAGIRVPALINEPTAAAMAAGYRGALDGTLMVVDWGGGTLDVTVLRCVDGVYIEEASAGVGRLGGLDFDAAIRRTIEEGAPNASSWHEAGISAEYLLDIERAKVDLSSHDSANVQLPDGSVRRLTREEFDRIARPLVERVRDPIERCLADLAGQPIDRLVLVGGTCNVPAVRALISEIVGLPAMPDVNPMTAIAEGAAIAAAILDGDLEEHDFFVSTEHALGTIAVDSRLEPVFSVIIPRNHKLPAKRTETYTPIRDFQTGIEFRIIEGDPGRPLDDRENVIYDTFEVDLPGRAMVDASVEATLEYDIDGLLHVSVHDVATGAALGQHTISFGAAGDPRRRVEIAKRVQATFDDGRRDAGSGPDELLSAEAAKVVAVARTKVLPFVDEPERDEIEVMIQAIVDGASSEQLDLTLKRRWPYLLD